MINPNVDLKEYQYQIITYDGSNNPIQIDNYQNGVWNTSTHKWVGGDLKNSIYITYDGSNNPTEIHQINIEL